MKKVIIITIITFTIISKINAQTNYFENEIGANAGATFWQEDNVATYNLDYAHFFSSSIGIRSGAIIYGSDFMNAAWGMKIPVYASFRTKSSKAGYDPYDAQNMNDSFGESILYSILGEIPLNFEFNIGPSLGYISPTTLSKQLNNEQKSDKMQYFPHTKLLVTMDANIRFCYNINNVGILFTAGGSYTLTNNFKYHSNKYDSDNGKIARWTGIVMGGLTYKF